jgi:hypothetical protein
VKVKSTNKGEETVSDFVEAEARRLEPDVVAHHEAGHAVACIVLNVTLSKRNAATIVPAKDYLGAVSHHRNWRGNRGRDMTTVTLCGPLAEDLYLGYSDGTCSIGDAQIFNAHAGDVLRDWGNDVTNHRLYLELRCAEWMIAKILLLEHWDVVKLIAAALLEKKTLDRKEVVDLYFAATKPQPKLLLDWSAHHKAVSDQSLSSNQKRKGEAK